MVYTMLKTTYTKLEPKISRKRSYKDFSKESVIQDLQHGLKIMVSLVILMTKLRNIKSSRTY